MPNASSLPPEPTPPPAPASSGADFQRLADVIMALSAARGREEVIEIVRRSARGLSGAQGVAVILNDDGYCHYLAEDAQSPLWLGQRFPMDSCISGWAMMHNETVSIPDVFEDPRIPHAAYRPTFVRSLIMAPVGEDQPFAAIGVYWNTVRTPDPEEIAVMQALARSTATAFKNVQLYEELTHEIAQRKRSEQHLRLMVHELNHRVKNSLATVQSMASQTFRASASVGEAKDAFSMRLHALSLIHEMLTEANWDSVDLRQIAARTLHAHLGPERDRVSIRGPRVDLSPKAGSSLAIALNELATNAIKHGALSGAEGRVEIEWAVSEGADGPELVLDWWESGGPPVSEPARRGFGERLLRRGLPADIEGTVDLVYAPTGVTCSIRAPMEALRPRPGDPGIAV